MPTRLAFIGDVRGLCTQFRLSHDRGAGRPDSVFVDAANKSFNVHTMRPCSLSLRGAFLEHGGLESVIRVCVCVRIVVAVAWRMSALCHAYQV